MNQKIGYEQSYFKIDYSIQGLVRLNLNENLVMPLDVIRRAMRYCERNADSRLYPSESTEGEMWELRSLLGKYCDCKPSLVELGCGSDQLIDLLCRLKLRKKDALVTVKPTFSMYALRARSCGARVVQVPVDYSSSEHDPFPLRTEKLVKACSANKAKLLFLASPNNPTGIQYNLPQLKEILESIPSSTLLVLDEAYVEYCEYTAKFLLRKYPNLTILRTFSKAFGLASHRLGYIVSYNQELKKEFGSGIQLPFPISGLAAPLALELLRQIKVILYYAKKTVHLRENLIRSLQDFQIRNFRVVERSDANFVLVESPFSEKIARTLLTQYRIGVKFLPKMIADKSFLRITVGTNSMNSRLLEALGGILPRLRSI
ncbi:MAG TPA: histidinol-phosphate transaminase [Nitrososphaerales archaeon]|nr:histidinol-phosphate transaminase [Nitrososphaerales archaeon]